MWAYVSPIYSIKALHILLHDLAMSHGIDMRLHWPHLAFDNTAGPLSWPQHHIILSAALH